MKNQNQESATSNPDLILVTGDLHIPRRVLQLPEEIKKILLLKKFQHILCTGNIGDRDNYEFLKSLCNNPNANFHLVKGENLYGDSYLTSVVPEKKTVKIGEFVITIINGIQIVPWGDYESLSAIQKETSCDIVISGYTHKPEVVNYEGKYFINPGSLSGAYSPLVNDPVPSFMIMVISGDICILYHYELNTTTKNFEVKKTEINKNKLE